MALIRLAACGLLALVGLTSVESTPMPPNFLMEKTCQIDGPVEVCSWNKHYPVPRLYIRYRGYLAKNESQEGKVNAWVRLNSREGTFKLEHVTDSETNRYEMGIIGDIKNVQCCFQYDPVPENEAALLFYAFDQNGKPNDWDVEVAFFAENGHWDSKYGQNYKFKV